MIVKRTLPLVLLAALSAACTIQTPAPTPAPAPGATAPAPAATPPAAVATPATAAATPKPKPSAPTSVPPPDGATVGRSNGANVVLRAGPRKDSQALGAIKQNQRLYIIRRSDNVDTIDGVDSDWVYVQTEDGKKGWVFGKYVQ